MIFIIIVIAVRLYCTQKSHDFVLFSAFRRERVALGHGLIKSDSMSVNDQTLNVFESLKTEQNVTFDVLSKMRFSHS